MSSRLPCFGISGTLAGAGGECSLGVGFFFEGVERSRANSFPRTFSSSTLCH